MTDGDEWRISPKQLLDQRNLRPRKRFGQNFLVDHHIAERIAEALPHASHAIEIGGGTGTLTAALLHRAATVTCLEIDRDLSALLHERFDRFGAHVRIVTTDALDFDFHADLASHAPPRVICGNLPYYITTPLLERILALAPLLSCAAIMVQREYARRLVAQPGTPDYGSLTLFAQYFCGVEKMFEVGAAAFYPAPAVASSVIRLTPHPAKVCDVNDEALLLRLIRLTFAHRRKTLTNSLLADIPGETARVRKTVEDALAAADLPLMVRAERLSLTDFCRLSNALSVRGVTLGANFF